MFIITESTSKILEDVIERERQTPHEELFVRLSMGVG
jgi:hypothetical protein